MALIVEDGTIVAGANSFVTVAEADAYIANFNDQVWAALLPADKDAHIVKGGLYVCNAAIYR